MTPEAFKEWLHSSRRGQTCIYYEGFLAIDRWRIMQAADGSIYLKANDEASDIGSLVYAAYRHGYVSLTQAQLEKSGYVGKDFSVGTYAYIATRTHRRLPRELELTSVNPLVMTDPWNNRVGWRKTPAYGSDHSRSTRLWASTHQRS